MSIQIDINSLGDLVALHGTEADRRAWARIRAERDDLRRRLEAAGEVLRITDPCRLSCARAVDGGG